MIFVLSAMPHQELCTNCIDFTLSGSCYTQNVALASSFHVIIKELQLNRQSNTCHGGRRDVKPLERWLFPTTISFVAFGCMVRSFLTAMTVSTRNRSILY